MILKSFSASQASHWNFMGLNIKQKNNKHHISNRRQATWFWFKPIWSQTKLKLTNLKINWTWEFEESDARPGLLDSMLLQP